AEDGIRDGHVTGVQTCALPILGAGDVVTNLLNTFRADGREFLAEHGRKAPIKRAAEPEEIAEVVAFLASDKASFIVGSIVMADRSEERRVGKGGRYRWWDSSHR